MIMKFPVPSTLRCIHRSTVRCMTQALEHMYTGSDRTRRKARAVAPLAQMQTHSDRTRRKARAVALSHLSQSVKGGPDGEGVREGCWTQYSAGGTVDDGSDCVEDDADALESHPARGRRVGAVRRTRVGIVFDA